MDYRVANTGFTPRSSWNPGLIPAISALPGLEPVDSPADHTTTTSAHASDWRQVIFAIIRALQPFPEARQTVIDAVKSHRFPFTDDV